MVEDMLRHVPYISVDISILLTSSASIEEEKLTPNGHRKILKSFPGTTGHFDLVVGRQTDLLAAEEHLKTALRSDGFILCEGSRDDQSSPPMGIIVQSRRSDQRSSHALTLYQLQQEGHVTNSVFVDASDTDGFGWVETLKARLADEVTGSGHRMWLTSCAPGVNGLSGCVLTLREEYSDSWIGYVRRTFNAELDAKIAKLTFSIE